MSTLERTNHTQNLQKDILNIISEKTVNPNTKRPYPVSMLEKALQELHYSLNTTRSAKQQVKNIDHLVAL